MIIPINKISKVGVIAENSNGSFPEAPSAKIKSDKK